MASKWSILFFISMVASIFYSSTAQRTHVVGDALWTVPTPVNYTNWASAQTFSLGDILVFNFTTGMHDVAEVTSAEYDACSSQSPISVLNTGPTSIILSSAGQHFYICNFPGHCGIGQKLAITVASVSPTPSPASTTSPVSIPSPAPTTSPVSVPSPAQSPARNPVTYVVGDSLGWTIPPGGPIAYQTWAIDKTFFIGDTLVFNFTNRFHDVVQLTSKADYDSCSNSTSSTTINNSPARITLTTPGENFFICTFPGHCQLGQKLAVNVSGAPATSISPSSRNVAPAPSPARTPATYVVGDALGWTIPPGGPIAYQTWAIDKAFFIGDILVFNFTNRVHDVVQLTSKADYDSCNNSSASNIINNSPASITLTTPGENFFICTFPSHCQLGQKLTVNVSGTPAASISPSGRNGAPSSPTTPDISTPPSPSSAPNVVVIALPITLLSIVFVLLY